MFRRILHRLRRSPTPARVPPSGPPMEPSVEPVDEEPEPDIEVDTEQLVTWLAADPDLVLVDIRESHEIRNGHVEGALLLRMNDIPARLDELPDPSTRLVIYCAAGMRSFGVTHWLREQGWTDTWSLTSGFSGAVEAGKAVVIPK